MFFSFHKKNAHLTKNDFPATIVWGYFFSLRGRRRAAAALLYKVPGTQRVKRRSVRFVCSMSAKKTSVSSMVVAFFCWRGRTSKKHRNRNFEFHIIAKTTKNSETLKIVKIRKTPRPAHPSRGGALLEGRRTS